MNPVERRFWVNASVVSQLASADSRAPPFTIQFAFLTESARLRPKNARDAPAPLLRVVGSTFSTWLPRRGSFDGLVSDHGLD
eukprot:6487785-Pyramimonas_sp.AAC.1